MSDDAEPTEQAEAAHRTEPGQEAGAGQGAGGTSSPPDWSSEARRADDEVGMEMIYGPCHYGDFDEEATAMATNQDGTGWIPVCDEHKQRAVDDGYQLNDNPTV